MHSHGHRHFHQETPGVMNSIRSQKAGHMRDPYPVIEEIQNS